MRRVRLGQRLMKKRLESGIGQIAQLVERRTEKTPERNKKTPYNKRFSLFSGQLGRHAKTSEKLQIVSRGGCLDNRRFSWLEDLDGKDTDHLPDFTARAFCSPSLDRPHRATCSPGDQTRRRVAGH